MDNVMEGQIMESRQDTAVTDEMENLRKNIKERMANLRDQDNDQEDDEEGKRIYISFQETRNHIL